MSCKLQAAVCRWLGAGRFSRTPELPGVRNAKHKEFKWQPSCCVDLTCTAFCAVSAIPFPSGMGMGACTRVVWNLSAGRYCKGISGLGQQQQAKSQRCG